MDRAPVAAAGGADGLDPGGIALGSIRSSTRNPAEIRSIVRASPEQPMAIGSRPVQVLPVTAGGIGGSVRTTVSANEATRAATTSAADLR